MAFIGLHNHTDYSNFRLRDSISKVEPLIEYAHELGHKGIALTEHECISSTLDAVKFYYSHKDKAEWKDFKIIYGNEIYLCPEFVTAENKENNIFPHFLLLALNQKGHEQIRKLSTIAWGQSFKQNITRVPTYYIDLETIVSKERGNVVGSSACLGGSLPKQLLKYKQAIGEEDKAEYWQSCVEWINYISNIFGKGYFFLELQPSDNEEQVFVNECLLRLSEQTNTPYIITTDSHYIKKDDREAHKIYLTSQEGEREVDDFYATTYVMSEEEIHEYLDKYIGYEAVQLGINNTMLIYDMAEPYDLRKPLKIPYLPLNRKEPNLFLYNKYKDKIPSIQYFFESNIDSDRHLSRDILDALDTDINYQNDKGYEAINVCLNSLKESSEKMNVHWSAYLLQIADYVDIAWKAGTLVGPGRGSGVGFCLLHMMEITQINPLLETTQTFYWRFLNPERASVLDIDIDIESSKRDVVIEKMKQTYGADRVSKVLTLSTEKSKSAILTACRGLNIEIDLAQYISSLIVADRGEPRSLYVMYHGDKANKIKPVYEFRNEMDKNPELWDMAQKFEGLICGVGSHAGGVIVVDEPFTKTTALMKTNSGDIVTQFDLHMCEDVSLIKVDLLCIDALDKIHVTLDFLLKDKVITWEESLKKTYEKYLGVYTLERNDPKMWGMLWKHEVLSFFQMEKESGIQGIALTHPQSVDDLATLNSVIRLMAQEDGAETPLQKYAKFKKDISLWYKEMKDYGLTDEEQDILKNILGISYGICEAQEYLFLLTMHPKIGGFSLGWADKLRKAVAKKKPKEFMELEQEYYVNAKEKQLSPNLINYVWKALINTQRGYGFNKSHTLSYSIVGLQELNLAFKYPIIYWNAANLIVDSGSLDNDSKDSTDYGKIATAIAIMKKAGVNITLPLINEASFGFVPDVKNNRIIYSLKALCGIGDEEAKVIIKNRDYSSLEDFLEKTQLSNKPNITLIKAGAFTELDNPDTRATMEKFLRLKVFKECHELTYSQYPRLSTLNILPAELDMVVRIKNFKDYVLDDEGLKKIYTDPNKKVPKKGYHDRFYILDDVSMPFFEKHFSEDSVIDVCGEYYLISEKLFLKEWKQKIEPLTQFLKKEELLNTYNRLMYQGCLKENAEGSREKWEMDALSFYYTRHELESLNREYYGVENFFELPEEPEPYDWYKRYINKEVKYFPKNKISRIAGTVINKAKDNNKHFIVLLTTDGVVNVKFNKGQYSAYNRQLSENGSVVDKSWFKRGTKLLICGYRRGSQFMAYRYADTVYQHTVMKINEIDNEGMLKLSVERISV